jgi:crotonobetainyl-CoA:carnitine CoA-transferase CaiB-like acyl-CoA transferase
VSPPVARQDRIGALRQTELDPSSRNGLTGRHSTGRSLPLDGVRVLDLGMVWAGPYTGRLLAGLGAEVIKVEGPSRPDGTRPDPDARCQGLFADLNRGKRSLVVDLSRVEGRDLFLKLAAKTDVVVENFSPRVMPNFGLSYATLCERNPGLVMLSMPAFASDGSRAGYVAYGSGLELATGLARRDSEGRPQLATIPYLDYLSGTYGALVVLAALFQRDQQGYGCGLELPQRNVAYELQTSTLWDGLPEAVADRARYPDVHVAQVVGDPHLQARRLFATPDPAVDSCYHLSRLPWKLHGVRRRQERSAPAFGADSWRILRGVLGLPSGQIAQLDESEGGAASDLS